MRILTTPGRKVAAAVLAALLIVGGGAAWRYHTAASDANTADHGAVSSSNTAGKHGGTADTPARTLSAADKQRLSAEAVAFEHATRDWGVDPASADVNGVGAADLVQRLRTPDGMDKAALDKVNAIPIDKDLGPDAASAECKADASSGLCSATPTGLAHQRATHWTMGARLAGDPAVTVSDDGSVTVKGLVRIILWSGTTGTYSELMPDNVNLWALRPLTGSTAFTDTLVMRADGKVVHRQTVKPAASWLADPWFSDWTGDALSGNGSLDDRVVHDIPMVGALPDLSSELSPAMGAQILDNRTTAPWDGWDALKAQHGWKADTGESDDDRWDPAVDGTL